MGALLLVALGVVMAFMGARRAGTPGGVATDHSSGFAANYPERPGTARGTGGWVVGELLETAGYVIVLVGLMLAL